jgi:hypothetical protein
LKSSLTLIAVLTVTGIVVGLAGGRWRRLRLALALIGPLYAAAVLIYSLAEGSTSICTGTGGTFRCTEVTYASTWGVGGSVAVGVATVLTMAPLMSVWLRNRIPSVVASIALPIVLTFTIGPAAWLPAWAAVLAAAVAGPPSSEGKKIAAPKP